MVMVSDALESTTGGLRTKVISLPHARQNPQPHMSLPET